MARSIPEFISWAESFFSSVEANATKLATLTVERDSWKSKAEVAELKVAAAAGEVLTANAGIAEAKAALVTEKVRGDTLAAKDQDIETRATAKSAAQLAASGTTPIVDRGNANPGGQPKAEVPLGADGKPISGLARAAWALEQRAKAGLVIAP